LLPDTEFEKCIEIGPKCMDDIALMNIPGAVKTTDGNVTVSIGIGLTTPPKDMKLESLINVADQALYRAKKEGRNCWRI